MSFAEPVALKFLFTNQYSLQLHPIATFSTPNTRPGQHLIASILPNRAASRFPRGRARIPRDRRLDPGGFWTPLQRLFIDTSLSSTNFLVELPDFFPAHAKLASLHNMKFSHCAAVSRLKTLICENEARQKMLVAGVGHPAIQNTSARRVWGSVWGHLGERSLGWSNMRGTSGHPLHR